MMKNKVGEIGLMMVMVGVMGAPGESVPSGLKRSALVAVTLPAAVLATPGIAVAEMCKVVDADRSPDSRRDSRLGRVVTWGVLGSYAGFAAGVMATSSSAVLLPFAVLLVVAATLVSGVAAVADDLDDGLGEITSFG